MLLPIVIRIIEMSTSISKQTKQIHEHNSLHSVQLEEGGEQFGNLKIMKHFFKVQEERYLSNPELMMFCNEDEQRAAESSR